MLYRTLGKSNEENPGRFFFYRTDSPGCDAKNGVMPAKGPTLTK